MLEARKIGLAVAMGISLVAHGSLIVTGIVFSNRVSNDRERGPIVVDLITVDSPTGPRRIFRPTHTHHLPLAPTSPVQVPEKTQTLQPTSESTESSHPSLASSRVYGEEEVDSPVKMTSPPAIRYPARAYRRGEEGDVELFLIVDPEGKVKSAEVVRGKSEEFEEAALEAARRLRFQPALKNGDPVSVHVHWTCRFRIEN